MDCPFLTPTSQVGSGTQGGGGKWRVRRALLRRKTRSRPHPLGGRGACRCVRRRRREPRAYTDGAHCAPAGGAAPSPARTRPRLVVHPRRRMCGLPAALAARFAGRSGIRRGRTGTRPGTAAVEEEAQKYDCRRVDRGARRRMAEVLAGQAQKMRVYEPAHVRKV